MLAQCNGPVIAVHSLSGNGMTSNCLKNLFWRTISAASQPLVLLMLLLSASPTIGAPLDGQIFEDWTTRCDPQEGPPAQCFIFQEVRLRESGQRVLRVVVSYIPGQNIPTVGVELPLGIFLPSGARIQVDDSEPLTFQIFTCAPTGCQAGFKLTEERMEQFRAGNKAVITFDDRYKQPTPIEISLNGFNEGLDSLQ